MQILIGIEIIKSNDVDADSLDKRVKYMKLQKKGSPAYKTVMVFAYNMEVQTHILRAILLRSFVSFLLQESSKLPDDATAVYTFGIKPAQKEKFDDAEKNGDIVCKHLDENTLPYDDEHEFRFKGTYREASYIASSFNKHDTIRSKPYTELLKF